MNQDLSERVVTFFDHVFGGIFTAPFLDEIEDFRTRRRVERSIQEAAEVASQPLERFLLNEQVDAEAAAHMLRHIERALTSNDGVNAELLAQRGLNPDSLAEDLLHKKPPPRNLIQQGLEDRYRLAMKATCLALVQAGPVIIEWKRIQFASGYELLDKLLVRLQEISQRIDTLGKAGQGSEDERFERTYLDYLIQRFGLIETGTVRMTTNLGVDLHTLFVMPGLCVRATSQDEGAQAKKDSEGLMSLTVARTVFDRQDNPQSSARQRLPGGDEASPAIEVVRAHPRCVIVGPPGSGKSTFLAWLQLALADGSASLGADGERWIPLLLRVRELDVERLPEPKDMLLAATANRELAYLRPGWLPDKLAAGQVVLLVDGLDETDPDGRDRYLFPWMKKLLQDYPDCRCVVSSRPVGYSPGWLQGLGFVESDILDFRPEHIGQYVRQWCTAVRMSQGEAESQARQEGEREGNALLEHIQANPYVHNLARNPLMLSAICLVQYFQHGELPNERALLYEWCVEGLLHHWDQRRGIRSAFSFDEKRNVVKELALAMQCEGLAEFPAERVRAIFSDTLDDQQRASNLLEHIRLRTGLLIERRSGIFAFAHLTFQEYLAALAIEEGNRLSKDRKFLVERYDDANWQEVIPLYCGVATMPNTRALLTALTKQPATTRLGYVLAHGILAAGRKLARLEREQALRCWMRCPAGGIPRPEEDLIVPLGRFNREDLAKIASQEIGNISVLGTSNAYHWLCLNPVSMNVRAALKTTSRWRYLTPNGQLELILILCISPIELVLDFIHHPERLRSKFKHRLISWPTMDWVVLTPAVYRFS